MNSTLIVTHNGEELSPSRLDLNDRIAQKVNDADFVIFYDTPGSCAPCPMEDFAKLGINAKQIFGGPIPEDVEDWGDNTEDYEFEICGGGADSLILGIVLTLRTSFPLATIKVDVTAVDSLAACISLKSVNLIDDAANTDEEIEINSEFFDVLTAILLRNGVRVFTSGPVCIEPSDEEPPVGECIGGCEHQQRCECEDDCGGCCCDSE